MKNIQRVVIVGGGTAGWMTAAALAKIVGPITNIILIESEQIGTVGVGEATIPSIRLFNKLIGLNENEFLQRTKGTIKLGIEFNNWGQQDDSYLHAFGNLGLDLGMAKFYQYWLRQRESDDTSSLWDYSFNAQAAKLNRFQPIDHIEGTPLSGLTHAFHFDAGLYASYLREHSEKQGVHRVEGKVERVNLNPNTGFIESVALDGEATVEGDLFIDCSGFRAILIDGALGSEYDDWSHYLPCDRAIAVPCEPSGKLLPYTKSTAHSAGWLWRIPLQHRIGNGNVFCSRFMSDSEAESVLMSSLDGEPTDSPRLIKFTTGMRRQAWVKNCVAIGLSSGFMEPLESTSIHLIQSSISRLLTLFPTQQYSQCDVAEFNRQTVFEFESIRDFLILHYKANTRKGCEFWEMCAEMPIPDSLDNRLNLFKEGGRLFRNNDELFTDVAWIQVLLGQGVIPNQYNPVADTVDSVQVDKFLGELKQIIKREASKLSDHSDYINHYAS